MLLPNEIWREICKLSTIPAAKNLRLVNKEFSVIAAECVFHTIHIALFPNYISMLSGLCDHPYLSCQPVELVISESHLDAGALLQTLKWLSDWDGNEYKLATSKPSTVRYTEDMVPPNSSKTLSAACQM